MATALELGLEIGLVLGVHEGVHGPAQGFPRAVAQDLVEGRVGGLDDAVLKDGDPLEGHAHEGIEILLAPIPGLVL